MYLHKLIEHLNSQEIAAFYGTKWFITVLAGAATDPFPDRSDESSP